MADIVEFRLLGGVYRQHHESLIHQSSSKAFHFDVVDLEKFYYFVGLHRVGVHCGEKRVSNSVINLNRQDFCFLNEIQSVLVIRQPAG